MEEKINKDIEEHKLWALIAYLGILFVLPLLLKKNSPYAQYHARQGLVLFVFAMIWGILGAVPFIGWFVIMPLGAILLFVLWLIGVVNALSGKAKPLPLIGGLAEKFKI
ncbi:MAG: hypothetical protein HZA37_02250 [Parcubacteria group bacterium]|nr:hypothetical protein [Parcubacteria group bacterium]